MAFRSQTFFPGGRMLVLFWMSLASVGGFAQQPALTGNETPLVRRLTDLLRGIGLEYRVTADPALTQRELPPGLQLGSPETFFDVLLPSQGWTYDMQGAHALQLLPSQTPWPGPSTLNRKIPSPFSEIRQKTTLENVSAQAAAQQLQNAFGMTVLLDCRIDPGAPIRGRVEADSLEGALNQLERGERWQWHVAEQIVLLMPGEEDRVLGLPNRGDRALIYADTPLSVAVEQLHSLFGIGMELPPALADTKVTGAFKGATLGQLLEGVCKSADCAFRVAGGKVVFGSKEEIARIPGGKRSFGPANYSPSGRRAGSALETLGGIRRLAIPVVHAPGVLRGTGGFLEQGRTRLGRKSFRHGGSDRSRRQRIPDAFSDGGRLGQPTARTEWVFLFTSTRFGARGRDSNRCADSIPRRETTQTRGRAAPALPVRTAHPRPVVDRERKTRPVARRGARSEERKEELFPDFHPTDAFNQVG